MPDPIEKLFDPEKLRNLWAGGKEESQPKKAMEELTPMAVFEKWERLIYSEFPTHKEVLKIWLDQVCSLIIQRTKPEGIQAKELEKNREQMGTILDQLEDLLEALSLNKSLPKS